MTIDITAEATDYRDEMIEKLEADIGVLRDMNGKQTDRLAAMDEHRKKCRLLINDIILSVGKLLDETCELDEAPDA